MKTSSIQDLFGTLHYLPPTKAEKEKIQAKSVQVSDLTEEQACVFNLLKAWALGEGTSLPQLVTLGGYAGCLSGDTIVNYTRGNRIGSRLISMRDLYLKFNGFSGSGRGAAQRWRNSSLPTYLSSLWQDGTVARNRLVGVLESGIKKVLRVDFSNGSHLVLTVDHPIATPGGVFVRADSLAVGDTVVARGSQKCAKGKGRRPISERPHRIIVNTKHHPGPVKIITCNGISYTYVRVSKARLVVEASMNNVSYEDFVHALKNNAEASAKFKYLPLGRSINVHHEDEDTLNDAIENLGVLSHADHARLHGYENESHFKKEYVIEVKVTGVQAYGEEMTYDIQMEDPANNFAANGIFVHNTGKTTLVSALGGMLSKKGKYVAYCAFTGKAANVLRHKLSHVLSPGNASYCGTIHRMLYSPDVDEKTQKIKGWTKHDELLYDLLIVDEASMVDAQTMEDLKSYGIKILAVGDHGQLPPVKGNFNAMQNPMLRLETIHRQAKGSPIIALSAHIREHGSLPKSWLGMTTPSEDGSSSVKMLSATATHGVLEAEFQRTQDAWEKAVICYTNRTRRDLNYLVRGNLGFGGQLLERDEQVVCLKNTRFMQENVYNGMRGLVQEAQEKNEHKLDAKVWFPEEFFYIEAGVSRHQFGCERTVSDFDQAQQDWGWFPKNWPEVGMLFDYGYALTCHKSQGDQWDHVIVLAERPKPVPADEYRRWIYTAVTRCKNHLTILVPPGCPVA